MDSALSDLQARVGRLEAEVARLRSEPAPGLETSPASPPMWLP